MNRICKGRVKKTFVTFAEKPVTLAMPVIEIHDFRAFVRLTRNAILKFVNAKVCGDKRSICSINAGALMPDGYILTYYMAYFEVHSRVNDKLENLDTKDNKVSVEFSHYVLEEQLKILRKNGFIDGQLNDWTYVLTDEEIY